MRIPWNAIASAVLLAAVFVVFEYRGVGCSKNKFHTTHRAIALKNMYGKPNLIPVAIIGSGPAGLSAAIYAARDVHSVVIQGSKPGGLLTETTEVENWPGERSIQGPLLVQGIQDQAEDLGAQFLFDSIERVDFSRWPYTLYTKDGKELHALSVIISTGAAPRKLGIPGENEYWGMGVTACAVCDAPFFKGEDVVVVGGGDSAIEEAMQLAKHVKSVTILVRKGKGQMRAKASMQERLNGYPNISVRYNVAIEKINGDGMKVTSIDLIDTETGNKSVLPISGVFLAVGHDPNTSLFVNQIEMDEDGYILLDGRSQRASLPGVFAAGDVEDRVYRQAGVASGSGIKAALDALSFLREIGFDANTIERVKEQFFTVQGKAVRIVPALGDEIQAATSAPEAKPVIKVTTKDELSAYLQPESGIVFVDFFADYCPSCMRMLPVYEMVAGEFSGRATFLKVDASEAQELMDTYFVQKIPCLLAFNNGQLVARYNEAMDKTELTKLVNSLLAGA